MKCCLAIAIMILISSCNGEENNSTQEIGALQELLNSYHFIYRPQIDVFDCVDMSVANYRFLRSIGYNTSIVIVEDGLMLNGTKLGHCMALVELSNGWAGIETKQAVINTNESIGKVIGIIPDYIRKIYTTPEEVYSYDIRGAPSVTGNVIEPNLPKAL